MVERDAMKQWLMRPVILTIILYAGIKASTEVLYEHYMKTGKPFMAFITRPIYFLWMTL